MPAELRLGVAGAATLGALRALRVLAALDLARCHRRQALIELLAHFLGVLKLRAQLERLAPLEARLPLAADPPVGVAQMIVERRISGHQPDCVLEVFDRLLEIAEPIVRPTQTVDDAAVGGPQTYGLLDEL